METKLKKLSLNKETLTELSSDELGQVAGGTHATCATCLCNVTDNLACTVGVTFHNCATTPFDQCVTKVVATIIG